MRVQLVCRAQRTVSFARMTEVRHSGRAVRLIRNPFFNVNMDPGSASRMTNRRHLVEDDRQTVILDEQQRRDPESIFDSVRTST
jgi:hypothetical protein